MQHGALNLLHSISPRPANYYDDVIFCTNANVLAWKKLNILECYLQRRPSRGNPWPSCWCRELASESSTPRHVCHSFRGGAQKRCLADPSFSFSVKLTPLIFYYLFIILVFIWCCCLSIMDDYLFWVFLFCLFLVYCLFYYE